MISNRSTIYQYTINIQSLHVIERHSKESNTKIHKILNHTCIYTGTPVFADSVYNLFVDVKKKKEQKQMEKEMQRLHLLSGMSAESK